MLYFRINKCFNKERFNFNTITNNQYILYFTNVHGLHRVWLFINEMLAFVYSYCTKAVEHKFYTFYINADKEIKDDKNKEGDVNEQIKEVESEEK